MSATVPSQGFSGHQMRYEYDNLYQLTKATYPNVAPFNGEVHSWTYDGIGNRLTSRVNSTTQSYTYQRIGANPLNWQRLVNDGVNAYTYDAKGNVQTRSGFSFGWTDQSRLRSISGGVTASYRYDYQGRRTVRTVGGATNTYVYDGLNLIRESGATPAEYLFGPGIDEPLAMVRGGQAYYYATDGLGSVSLVTNASGAVQNSYVYDAWGGTRSQTGSLGNPFGYTARELGEAGSLFYRARQYSPAVGRFLSEDPLGYFADLNLYRYVENDPVDFVDHLGLIGGRSPVIDAARKGASFCLNAAQGAGDFWRNYREMRNVNTINADRFFHCVATCQAASRGLGGQTAAVTIGEAREWFDEHVKGDPPLECERDRQANNCGFAARGGDCYQGCSRYLPPSLRGRYPPILGGGAW